MVSDLTGMPLANASLLDEGTAAAEAMILSFAACRTQCRSYLVDSACHPQTIACVQMRAQGLGINVIVSDIANSEIPEIMGALLQYPNTFGHVTDYADIVKRLQSAGALVACATDLLALAVLKPPGEFGADIVLGSSQRFGVPLGFGG